VHPARHFDESEREHWSRLYGQRSRHRSSESRPPTGARLERFYAIGFFLVPPPIGQVESSDVSEPDLPKVNLLIVGSYDYDLRSPGRLIDVDINEYLQVARWRNADDTGNGSVGITGARKVCSRLHA
jgi:hypothetical protein